MRRGLQQQRRLADARLTAEKDERTWDYSAPQHAIELTDAGREPHRIRQRDIVVQLGVGTAAELTVAILGSRCPSGIDRDGWPLLDQRVPGSALGAAPDPFRGLRPALLADEHDLGWFHG